MSECCFIAFTAVSCIYVCYSNISEWGCRSCDVIWYSNNFVIWLASFEHQSHVGH